MPTPFTLEDFYRRRGLQQFDPWETGSMVWGRAGEPMGGSFKSGMDADELRSYDDQYNLLTTSKDALGRLRYGTDISGVTAGGGFDPVDLNGQQYMRSGTGWAEMSSGGDPTLAKFIQQMGIRPEDFDYSEEYGNLLRAGKYTPLMTQYSATQQNGLTDMLTSMPLVLGGLATGAALGGAFAGTGEVLGAGGSGAFEGALASGSGSFDLGGLLSQLGGGDTPWGVNPQGNPFAGAESGGELSWLDDLLGGENPFGGAVADGGLTFENPFAGAVGEGAGSIGLPNNIPTSLGRLLFGNSFDPEDPLGSLGGAGGALAGLGGAGGLAGLAARIAPGMAALNFAREQGTLDTAPLSNLLGGGGTAPPASDTARLTQLFNGTQPQYNTDTSRLQSIGNQYAGVAQPIDTSRFNQIYNQYGTAGNPFDTSQFNQVYGNASNLGRGFDTSAFTNVYNNAGGLGRAFDTSGLSQVANEAGGLGRGFDTTQFSNLSGQVNGIIDPLRSSVLGDYDQRTGQARGELLGNLERRGVAGSSFGNMDVSNFDTSSQNQRGMLAGNLGLQGLSLQRGLAQDVLGAQQSSRGFEQAGLGLRGNIANQLLQAQQSQRGYEQAGLGMQLQAGGQMQDAAQSARGFEQAGLAQQGNIAQQLAALEQSRRQLGLSDLAAQSGLAQNMFNADVTQRELGLNALNAQRGVANDILGAQNLDRNYGLNMLTQQRGIANDILGATDRDRTFGLNQTNSQANIASQLMNAQLQQRAIQSALYGRAFDVIGRAVSPSPSLFGGA